MDYIEWCKKKIKEASDNANLADFEAYTELLKHWTQKSRSSSQS